MPLVPLALFIHLISVQLMFGITYEYVGGGAKDQAWKCILYVCGLPLELWEFKEVLLALVLYLMMKWMVVIALISYDSGVRHLDTTQDQASRMQRNLTFKDALLANQVHSDIGRLRRVEVERYIPNPRRREFGILKIN